VTGREKIEASFAPGGSPELAVVVPYELMLIRDHWEDLTLCPWWYYFSPDVDQQLAWRRDVIRTLDQDWFLLPTGSPCQERKAVSIEPCGNHAQWLDRRSGESRILRRPPVGGWVSPPQDEPPAPQAAADVDRRVAPPPDWSAMATDGSLDLAAALLREFGGDYYLMDYVGTPFSMSESVWGFETAMVLAVERPDLVSRTCERLLEHCLARVRQAALKGVAGIWIEDVYSGLVSPNAYGTFGTPYVQELIAEIHALSMRAFYYYCGDPAGRWEHILSLGADALAFEESKKDFRIEIEDVVARVDGSSVVLGNLDAIGVLQDGDDDVLRAEVERQTAAGRRNGGRFIMSLGSPVTPATSLARVRRYCELARETRDS